MTLPILFLAAALTNVTGYVTFVREGVPFYFMTEATGKNWRVSKVENPEVNVGDLIVVSGKKEMTIKNRLSTDNITVLSHEPLMMPKPKELTITEIFKDILPYGNSELYGASIVTEGILRDINRRQVTTQLLVGEGDHNIQVEIPLTLEEHLPKNLVQGARVRVTGNLAYTSIENYEERIFGRIEDIELIPLSESDVEVVRNAPFWTNAKLSSLLYGLLVLLLLFFIWVVSLQRMVAKRTKELGDSIRMRERERIEADAVRRERLRLAADLHDGFQQYLAGAMFRLKAAMNRLPKDATDSLSQLDQVKNALQHTQNGLRSTLWAMNEECEGPESLIELFNFTARRMAHWEGIVDIAYEGKEQKIARRSAGTLLLIMQEAVGNALKHGNAEHIRVRLTFKPKMLIMTVVDDGDGFKVNESASSGHYGMSSMERRTNELGGTMTVWSKGSIGTKLVFSFPQ